ncbi:MAG TPA: glycosyltransferase [Verrucomicrobiae bacterium]
MESKHNSPIIAGQNDQSSFSACPVCRSSAPVGVAKKGKEYHLCPTCGCVFTPHIESTLLLIENNGSASRHDKNQDAIRLQRLVTALGRFPEQVIDFGCGQGETARFLRAQDINAVGIDQDTALQLKDIADESVDGIMMVEVVEHLYDPQPIFQQFSRVLKPGGGIYLESSFADGKELATWAYLDPAIGHCTVHSIRSISILAGKNGFGISWLNPNVCHIFKKAILPTAAIGISKALPTENFDSLHDACATFLAKYAGASHPEFLAAAYRFFLQRGQDESGYNEHLTHLYAGADRAELIQAFVHSEEFEKMRSDGALSLAKLGPAKFTEPLPPRSTLEQYQDIWIKGKVHRRGVRECEDRFNLIRDFCRKFQRPFTILDIGANLGYFSLRLTETFDCTSLAFEGVYGDWIGEVLQQNKNPRVILAKKIVKLADLRALAEVEHFDVVLGLSVIHHLDGGFDESLEVLRSLGDHLILELPFEANACGQKFVQEAVTATLPPDAVFMGFGKSHLAEGQRRIVRLSRPKTSLVKSYMGTPRTDLSLTIHSDFTEKRVEFHNKIEKRPWLRGINLQTYLWFNGAYPSKLKIARQLEQCVLAGKPHRDIQPWNVILQGDTVQLIDSDDPNHTFAYDDRQYLDRLLSLLRAEPKDKSKLFELDDYVVKREGVFNYLGQDVLPLAPNSKASAEWLAATAQSLANLLGEVGPFYLHFGGAGDALLLLATFLEKNPDAQIVSFPNSIPAARSFFEAFPSLKRVWFLPKNDDNQIHLLLRMLMRHIPNCKGMGVTPEIDYFKEWHAKLNIFKQYGVSKRPEWVKRFRTNHQPKQITLAPKGSLQGMLGSKRNIIDPAIWPQLLRFIRESGFTSVIIGTPDENKFYPAIEGCEDRRSYSFREQMEHIANSAALIAADSWAKTFSALAGIPTLVFEPLKGVDWVARKDASDFVFIDPWDAITVVKNLEQCRNVFARIAKKTSPMAKQPAKPVVSWEGSFLDHGSLSHVNRELTAALQAFPEFQIKHVSTGAQSAPGFENLTCKISTSAPSEVAVTVRHAWPPDWKRPRQGKLAVIQPWEFGALPEDWVRQSHDVDEFWVPSGFVRNCYIESGIPAQKVFAVPNGVNAEKFHPQAAPMRLATQKKFKFLFVGGTIGRKGPDLLLQAFLKNFTAADDVCLVIKDFGGKSFYAGQTFESQIRAAQSLPDAPEILYLNEEFPPDALPGLYTACDCLVLPYRGEGFGLPVLEAMACGLPVIVTAGGATDDFVRDEFAWRIPAARKIFGNEVGGMKLAAPGWLLEPNLAALGETMRRVFENPVEARERGKLASRHAHQFYSWKNSAAIVAQRIRELAQAPTKSVKTISMPPVAQIGQLNEARELFRQKKFPAAWDAAVTAIAKRPFHPEAFLLLAEIALAAGDSASARQCAQCARDFAPGWNLAKQFLKRPLCGNAEPEWLKLPEEVQSPKSKVQSLSVCLIVKNEEKFLAQCLKSIRAVARQIIVVDTGSTDRTVEIAKEFGAEIYSFTWCDDFSAARNAALEHATGDWILMLDADEELSEAEHEKLRADMKKTGVIAHRLPLVNRGNEAEGPSFVPRLFRNAPGVYYFGRIHEQVFPSLLSLGKPWGLHVGFGTAQLLHHGYTKEMVRDRNKIARNLNLLRQAVEENPADANLMMNFGLELVRSDDLAGGVVKYRQAFELMSAQSAVEVAPELREIFLTQFTCQLYKIRAYEEVVRVLNSPLAKRGGLAASHHFALGLAQFELNNFGEAAAQMRQCLANRKQPSLSPINTDIFTVAPEHCLALSLAKMGDAAGAEKVFQKILAEPGQDNSESVKLDFVKFLAGQNRFVEALQKLHELVAANARNSAAWRTGGEIALSKPEFLEFARDWTAEAVRYAAEDFRVVAQRAEALMLGGDTAAAMEFWERVWNAEHQPRALAALILCQTVEMPTTAAPDDAMEPAASRAFIAWYQRLIAMRGQSVIGRINERTDKLSRALPTAAKMIEKALAETLQQRQLAGTAAAGLTQSV